MAGTFPIVRVEVRYGGAYSRGAWLAVAEADQLIGCRSRADFVLDTVAEGPHGDDPQAIAFWSDPPGWIAAGGSPQEAIARLPTGPAKLGH